MKTHVKRDDNNKPIKQNKQQKVDMPNVWDLMMNKKPGRRGGRKSDDNNPFGI